MYARRFLAFFLLQPLILFNTVLADDKPISQQGSVSFILHTDQTYSNGKWQHEFKQTLVELPGLATCNLERSYGAVTISFDWENDETHKFFLLQLTDLPGPAKYALHFTWDAAQGLAEGYLNGLPFRLENSRFYYPWQVVGLATGFKIPPGPNRVTDMQIEPRYLSEDEVRAQVPGELLGSASELLAATEMPSAIDVSKRKGKLVYASKMNDEASMQGWVLEGPAEITFEDGQMVMRSTIPKPTDGSTGHFNYWCPADVPESFIAEWEFKPVSERGLCLIFFSSKGQNGQDVFDEGLPERDGHFQQYVNGALNNYWMVYFSNHRLMRTTNIARTYLSKASKSRTLAAGQIGVTPGSKQFHRMRLIKDGAHIQLLANGKVCLDFIDPGGERWGPALGAGKISLRQMAFTVGAYRNFNVWGLH